MNYRKKGLKKLIDLIINRKISRLVLTHKEGINDSFYIGNDHIKVKGKCIRLPNMSFDGNLNIKRNFMAVILHMQIAGILHRKFVQLAEM